jgi:hypothetical protein
VIPAGTNASLVGVWRVVDLTEPPTLQPGFYQLGGLDSLATADVIEYVSAGPPWDCTLTPPGSPLVIGSFFYARLPGNRTNFYPTTSYYAAWGLELGPMLFGTKAAPPSPGSGLSIRLLRLGSGPFGEDVLLMTWSAGTLQQADAVTGPNTATTNAASPYIFLTSPRQKFYRSGP